MRKNLGSTLSVFVALAVASVASTAAAMPQSSGSSSSESVKPVLPVEKTYTAECGTVQNWDKVRQAITYQIQTGYALAGYKGKVSLGRSKLTRPAAKTYKSSELVPSTGALDGDFFYFKDGHISIVNESCKLSGPIAVTFRGKDASGKAVNETYPFNITVDGHYKIK